MRYDDGRVTTTRVPQEERTRAMRQRLLDACVECLVERGWSGTSTTLVSQRAGVSRGAQLHHFPTRRLCNLASLTSFYFDGDDYVGWGYAELAGR